VINAGVNTIMLTGTNTLWSADAATFSLSGGTGASIGNQNVVSNTLAYILVTPGTALATLTVADASTAATQTIGVVAVTSGQPGDPNIVVSPNAFALNGNAAWETALYSSNEMYFGWVAGLSDTLSVHVDTTNLSNAGVTGASPVVYWSVGVGSSALKGSLAIISGTVISGQTRRIDMVTSGAALAAGTYPVTVWWHSGSGTDGIDSWNTPDDLIRVLAFTHHDDSGITTAAYPYARSKKMLVFGDSEAQGRNYLG